MGSRAGFASLDKVPIAVTIGTKTTSRGWWVMKMARVTFWKWTGVSFSGRHLVKRSWSLSFGGWNGNGIVLVSGLAFALIAMG